MVIGAGKVQGMPRKVCYLSTGIMDTAFDSQVWPLLESGLQSGFDLVHVALSPFRCKMTDRYLHKKEELESTGIKTLYFQQGPPVSRFFLRKDTKRMVPFLRKWWGGKERLVIHCRGHLNAYRGLLLQEPNPALIAVIGDLRGAVSDEVGQGRGLVAKGFGRYLRHFYQQIERQVVERADAILCVSNAFKEFLQTRYDVKNPMIIPTYVDTSRFIFSHSLRQLYREKLRIADRTVLTYSGGVAPWQRIEDTIDLFVRLKENAADLFMLFLTQEPARLKKMIGGKIQPYDFTVLQVPHWEVPGYLSAADVGVLLREDRLTNHVAAPIKFSEYMCCGLPCILSKNIGDTAQVIREIGAGIVLDSEGKVPSVSEIRSLLALNREEISKRMHQKYSSKIYFENILGLYRTLGEGGLA
jgi:glycosyltransferase involved in cell wall biosynthesis